MVETGNLFSVIKGLIEDTFKRIYVKPFGLYIVSDTNPSEYTVNIKDTTFPTLQYSDVRVMGNGIGNLKGIVNMPNKDDLVLVAFIDRNTPIVIGNLFANLVTSTGAGTDTIPNISDEDLLIINKSNGANIRLHGANGVKINKGDKGIARIGDQIQVEVTWTDGAGSGTFTGTIIEGSENVLID